MESWEAGRTDKEIMDWLIELVVKKKKDPYYVISKLSHIKRKVGERGFIDLVSTNQDYPKVVKILKKYMKIQWKKLEEL